MSGLIDPGMPAGHPRARYHADLLAGESITWWSTEQPVEVLVDYVLGLLDLSRSGLRVAEDGTARSDDGTLRLTAAAGERGAVLTVWGEGQAGTARIDRGMTREWNAAMATMSRGEQVGNAARAHWAPIVRGRVRDDFAGSPVTDVINAATVVPVVLPPAPVPPAGPPAGPPVPPPPAASSSGAGPRRVVTLTKGGNVSLTKEVGTLTRISVGLGWDVDESSGRDFDLDASALVCGPAGKVLSDQHFVFFNNLASPDGTVVHTGDNLTGEGDGDDEVVEMDLARMSPEVDRIVVAVSIYEAESRRQSFGQVHNAFIRLVDLASGAEIARYDLTEDASIETAMIFGEVYRRDREWKFRAVGQGFASGLHGIALQYGVSV